MSCCAYHWSQRAIYQNGWISTSRTQVEGAEHDTRLNGALCLGWSTRQRGTGVRRPAEARMALLRKRLHLTNADRPANSNYERIIYRPTPPGDQLNCSEHEKELQTVITEQQSSVCNL